MLAGLIENKIGVIHSLEKTDIERFLSHPPDCCFYLFSNLLHSGKATADDMDEMELYYLKLGQGQRCLLVSLFVYLFAEQQQWQYERSRDRTVQEEDKRNWGAKRF